MFRLNALKNSTKAVMVLSLQLSFALNAPALSFDPKEMDVEISPSVANLPKKNVLTLAGVGMRRKNLYITEVDVYFIGINLSEQAMRQAKAWSSQGKSNSTLADALYDSTKPGIPTETKMTATLKFHRTITKDQFLTAFDDALRGCSAEAIAEFKAVMGKSIKDSVSTKDSLVIHWLDNGEMIFAFNGVFGDVLKSRELNKRLLEVYIDPSRTVSKELYSCLEKQIDSLSL